MRAACTYAAVASTGVSQKITAIDRWGDSTVRRAESIAKANGLTLLLLTPPLGLVPANEVAPQGKSLASEDEIICHVDAVAQQLEEFGVKSLVFFSNPVEKRGIAYLRLIIVACYLAEVDLELRLHHGAAFPDWSFVMKEAEEARLMARSKHATVEQIFAPLMQTYRDDGMVWFKRGETHDERGELEFALGDYRRAEVLFPMREWKSAARQAAESVRSRLPTTRAVGGPFRKEIELVSRLVLDPTLKALTRDALRLAEESPAAAVSLSRTALIRIVQKLGSGLEMQDRDEGFLAKAIDRLRSSGRISEQVKNQMHRLRQRRNRVEYDVAVLSASDARFCAEKLVEILKAGFPVR